MFKFCKIAVTLELNVGILRANANHLTNRTISIGLQHFIKDLLDNFMYGDHFWTLSYVLIHQYNWLMFYPMWHVLCLKNSYVLINCAPDELLYVPNPE